MLKDIRSYEGIYLALGATDLRKAVNGLAVMIETDFHMDPFENAIYLFCNRSRNRLKALTWDKNGFVLYYKRLDGEGARLKWPKEPGDVRHISVEQLRLLLSGMSIDPPKGFDEVTARAFY
jgi:transposase